MSVENSIEIHRDDFIFGIVVLQLCRCYPFLKLTDDKLWCAEVLATREEILCKLLCQGTAATFVVTSSDAEDNTQQSSLVYARVLIESDIFNGKKSVDKMR